MSFRHDVYAIFGWSSEGGGNGHVIADFAHDTVNGWVHPKSLTNDSIQEGEILELFVGRRTKFTIRRGEEFNLFLIQSFADCLVSSEVSEGACLEYVRNFTIVCKMEKRP